MNIPFIILCSILILGLGMNIESHGKPKVGKDNGWTSFISVVVIIGLTALAIYYK